MITSDMEVNMDPSQYENKKRTSTQHYYILKLLHQILISLVGRKNEGKLAIIASLIDWKEAFLRQCHRLGVNAFIKMGVRPSLIPVLVDFFKDRRMAVKWHGKLSRVKTLNGSGPQG